MNNGILKGTIFITSNIDIIYNTPMNGTVKIINLDEDGVLNMNSSNIIGGTCLLPPMEAKIAEADGNEMLYDNAYSSHLLMPFQQQFIAALIAFLYKGGNLILFLPELGYTNTIDKLVEHLFKLYGLHPGIIGHQNPQMTNCYYDAKCIPIWLNLIFIANVISAYEYLYMYPEDASIFNDAVINQLIYEIQPFGDTMNERIEYINRLHRLIHKNPKVVPAIQCLEV